MNPSSGMNHPDFQLRQDWHRAERTGLHEAVLARGKSLEQLQFLLNQAQEGQHRAHAGDRLEQRLDDDAHARDQGDQPQGPQDSQRPQDR